MSKLMKSLVVVAKLGAIAGFLLLVFGTYTLRSKVLVLSEIRFSADNVRVENDLRQLEESFPNRLEEHAVSMQQYELRVEHYEEMLDLYKNDYDEYVKRIEDKYTVPQIPIAPNKPRSPEISKQLYEINADFRKEKHQYFAQAIWLNRIATGAAMTLVGCLIFLMMFDTDSPRWHYLVAVVISFVFLIGPSFHSIMTGLIGVLEAPSIR